MYWLEVLFNYFRLLYFLRLKEIIKSQGGPDFMPTGKPKKDDYVKAAISAVRVRMLDNFQEIATFFRSESTSSSGKKKGFGGS